jgi:hypothetical protein
VVDEVAGQGDAPFGSPQSHKINRVTPHFPSLRSAPMALSVASRRKQIPGS